LAGEKDNLVSTADLTARLEQANRHLTEIQGALSRAEDRRSEHAAEEERLRTALNHFFFRSETSPLVPWTADGAGNFTDFSDRWLELTGLTREQALGNGWIDASHPDDLPTIVPAWTRSVQSSVPYDVEHRIRVAGGGHRWMRSRAVPQLDGAGKVVRWFGTTEDVHDRKLAEFALRDSETRARSMFEQAAVGVGLVDLDGRFVEVNDQQCLTLGRSREALLKMRMQDVTHPDDLPTNLVHFERLVREGRAFSIEKRYLQPDGSFRWVENHVSLLRDRNGLPQLIQAVVVDITEKKAFQEALELQSHRVRTILDNAESALVLMDSTGRVVTHNAAFLRVSGYQEADVYGRTTHELVHYHYPDGRDFPIEECPIGKALFGLHAVKNHEDTFVRKDGGFFPVVVHMAPVRGDDGTLLGAVLEFRDVTQERSQAAALREGEVSVRRSEARWRFLARLSDALRASHSATEMAQQVCELLATELNLMRSTYTRVDLEQDRAWVQAEFVRGAPSVKGEHRPSAYGSAVWLRSLSGEIVVNRNTATDPSTADHASYDAIGTRAFVHIPLMKDDQLMAFFDAHAGEPRDWTPGELELMKDAAARLWEAVQRSAAEEALREANASLEARVAERTIDLQASNDALQGFTYHVSHDLRSPLRAIVATSRMLQEDHAAALDEEALMLLARQSAAATKMGHLIDDLLRLSRLSRQELQKSRVDLTSLAREAALEAQSMHTGTCVRVEVEVGMETQADPQLLRLALVNLIENAVKYSPQGGTVRVRRRDGDTFFVSDEGIGIQSQYLERIFEPFQRLHRDEEFRGTGIGLANVRQVVERHGGRVWAESQPELGSTFFFTLG